jgi:hypothetical protein
MKISEMNRLGKEKDLLFVNKKKQKNFVSLGPGVTCAPSQTYKSFLLLFFKKEDSSFTSP